MIRIYVYSQVDPAEIFQLETPISRVEEPVAAILADVKKRATPVPPSRIRAGS